MVDKVDPAKSAPISGATCQTTATLGFEERKKKSLSPRPREPTFHTSSSDKRTSTSATSQPRRPARELFPPIELKPRTNRKTTTVNSSQSTNEVRVQFSQLSIDDKQVNANEPKLEEPKIEGNAPSGFRLEKRSYKDPVAGTYEEQSWQQDIAVQHHDKTTIDLSLSSGVSMDEHVLPVKEHLASSRADASYMKMVLLSLLVILFLDIIESRTISNV